MQDNIVDDGFVEDKLREAGRNDLADEYIENGKRVEPALDVIAVKTKRTRDGVESLLRGGDVTWSLL